MLLFSYLVLCNLIITLLLNQSCYIGRQEADTRQGNPPSTVSTVDDGVQ